MDQSYCSPYFQMYRSDFRRLKMDQTDTGHVLKFSRDNPEVDQNAFDMHHVRLQT